LLKTLNDQSVGLAGDEKAPAASAFDYLSYCGEEDLLGHYLLNYKESDKRHVIGPKNEAVNGIMVGRLATLVGLLRHNRYVGHRFLYFLPYVRAKVDRRARYVTEALPTKTCTPRRGRNTPTHVRAS